MSFQKTNKFLNVCNGVNLFLLLTAVFHAFCHEVI